MKTTTYYPNPKLLIFLLILVLCTTWPALATDSSSSPTPPEQIPLLVMLHFDDGYKGVFENAFSLMDKYGYVGTLFIPTTFIDLPKHMRLDQIQMMKKAGWEIGSHTRTHPDLREVDQATLYDEVVGSRNVLNGHQLLTMDKAYFCSPLTAWNTSVALMVSKHYQAARSKELNIFGVHVQPPQYVKVILKDTELKAVEQWIKQAKADNAWLILVFHEIAEGGNEYFFSPESFEQVLQLLKTYDAKVTTIEDAIQYWKAMTQYTEE